MMSLDTETNGVDFRHGSKPFFVTTCDERGDIQFLEWDVDPFTREPTVPPEDVRWLQLQLDRITSWGNKGGGVTERSSLRDDITERHVVVTQNGKFDVAALKTIGVERWPWTQTRDTLLAGHLLASNLPHDLTTMTLQYLGVNILPLEKRLEEAVKKARSLCRRKAFKAEHGEWAIAEHGRPDMPSFPKTKRNKAGRGDERDVGWKFDCWLPKTLYDRLGPGELKKWTGQDCSDWEGVLRDYANKDSDVTVALWREMRGHLRKRGLWDIYLERLKLLPVVYEMEQRGLTLSRTRLEELSEQYQYESAESAAVCMGIAEDYRYDLVLPAGAGPNKSLRTFVLDVMQLEPVRNPKAKTDAPTLDKTAMSHYIATLPVRDRRHTFVKELLDKRARDTAVAYMNSYTGLWQKWDDTGTYKVYPRLNPTGTDTLRFSHDNPNEANISKRENFNLRYCFGPAPGREWWSKDAKGIEDRLPAYESGQQELIDIFEKAGEPPYYGSNHLLRFHAVYPDVWDKELAEVGFEKVGPHCKKKYASTLYQYCKNGGFAVQYGAVYKANGWGTADKAFHKQYAHRLLKERFGKAEALNQKWIRYANKYGYVETIPDRTVDPKRGYPIMCTRTEYGRVLETVPLNYHIQGSAMWWTSKAMVRVTEFYDRLNRGELFEGRRWDGGYYVVMQVHDELVSDTPCGPYGTNPWEYNLPVMREACRLMAMGGDDFILSDGRSIPTPVGLEYHANNWSEGVTVAV